MYGLRKEPAIWLPIQTVPALLWKKEVFWGFFWDCGYLNSAVSLQLRETDTKKRGLKTLFFVYRSNDTTNIPTFLYTITVQNCQGSLCRGQVDLAGIEPASESLFIKASPITVAVLTFPWMYAHRQAYNLSSFMIHLPGQSLPGKVSHMVDVRFLKCECIRADEQQLGC